MARELCDSLERPTGPLLTKSVHDALCAAVASGRRTVECSLDLGRSSTTVEVEAAAWHWSGQAYPYLARCRDRTIYYWTGSDFEVAARYSDALYKLVPTVYGPPTFEIDGIKMLPTARVSPCVDAERKVALVEPGGRRILDTCGGLGYFAASCLAAGALEVCSFEKSRDVLWLRRLNPWSPAPQPGLTLTEGDCVSALAACGTGAFDAVLHDPPRFGIAGELYSQAFYDSLARVLKPAGRLFHYTGTPNAKTSGRDVPAEVAQRLRRAGFVTGFEADGVLARRCSPTR